MKIKYLLVLLALTAMSFPFHEANAQSQSNYCDEKHREPNPADWPQGSIFSHGFEFPYDGRFPVVVNIAELGSHRTLKIRTNGDPEIIAASGDGQYRFKNRILCGETYTLEIIEQPSEGDKCTIVNGTGVAGRRADGSGGDAAPLSISCGKLSLWDIAILDQDNWE